MRSSSRVLIIDLLVERAEFGHGGNQEVIKPLVALSDVQVLLVTPQMQSFEEENSINSDPEIKLTKSDVPNWDHEYDFWDEKDVEIGGKSVNFKRILMPMHKDEREMKKWIIDLELNAVVCSGSRRNVSMWEDWMSPTETMLRIAAKSGIPTLGICFGHQLLCHSLGSQVERATSFSSGIWNLELTKEGMNDVLLTSHVEYNENISGLFSHQDHVMSIPNSCTLLSKTDHNMITAIRVNDKSGNPMPAWGIQFHPEAARKRIERAYGWGHISEEEYKSFKGEHDGAKILESFANIVLEKM